ncbi:endonuclease/exonuclease/phosphatase family protein [Clostridium estertheticum]|uniref:endonuclease/exonuclease/phosphatase family protein n=1 Tax=Clostridium estertheticum TaxID=238834 RepID=UPI001C7DF993|nr:endonuclease/exonuclease/phosphatase family protein [Clostridium estertheticum]MBX4268450.1 hypothetical protein [Clostridium estertheticum]WLC81490.1 hypothetical protein KTC98_09905 [Clostridium estertheticum]
MKIKKDTFTIMTLNFDCNGKAEKEHLEKYLEKFKDAVSEQWNLKENDWSSIFEGLIKITIRSEYIKKLNESIKNLNKNTIKFPNVNLPEKFIGKTLRTLVEKPSVKERLNVQEINTRIIKKLSNADFVTELNNAFVTGIATYCEKDRRIINFLNKCEVDILACQELPKEYRMNYYKPKSENCNFSFKPTPKEVKNYFTAFCIKEPSKHHYEVVENKIKEKIWNKLYNKTFKYDNSVNEEFRDGLWAEIVYTYKGKEIRLVNIHIPVKENHLIFRLTLLEYLKELKEEYTIVLGDFNAAKNNDTVNSNESNQNFLKAIEDLGYKELRSEEEKEIGHYTHFEKNGGRKLDHIFVSSSFEEKKCTVSFIDDVNFDREQIETKSKYEYEYFTDHSGIIVEVQD